MANIPCRVRVFAGEAIHIAERKTGGTGQRSTGIRQHMAPRVRRSEVQPARVTLFELRRSPW